MGSEYKISERVAHSIREKMHSFLKQNPPGTTLTIPVMGESLTVKVMGTSYCPEDQDRSCEIELMDTRYGGLANIELYKINDEWKLKISGADFPYPAEYVIAREKMGIPVREDRDWCLHPREEHFVYCSKRRW